MPPPAEEGRECWSEAVRRERELDAAGAGSCGFRAWTPPPSPSPSSAASCCDLFGQQGDRGGLAVNVLSFGFKHGIPIEADLVFDVRFMPNPYYVPELKTQDGAGSGGAGLRVLLPPDQRISWSSWRRC